MCLPRLAFCTTIAGWAAAAQLEIVIAAGMKYSYQQIIKKRVNIMPTIAKRTFSLPAEHTKFIDRQVRSGAYASASEVVRAGLRALKERDEAVERWLREDVAPVYDAMKSKPTRGVPAAKVFAGIRARHTKRLKAAKRAKA